MEKRNNQLKHGQPMEQTSGSGSLSIIAQVSRLANAFDDQGVLHGQVSLAAVDQICVIHEAMNGCKET